MSDVVASIEAEAERILEDARRRAQAIIAEAKAEAERLLADESYKKELEEYRASLESALEREVREILLRAESEAKRILSLPEDALVKLAKRLASRVAGVPVE